MDAGTVNSVLQPAVENMPLWLQILMAALGTLVTGFLLPFLKQKAQAAQLEAVQTKIDTTKSLLEQKQILVNRLKAFLEGTAAAIGEKRWPIICQKIQSGQLKTAEQIKAELKLWGVNLKGMAVAYFDGQGIDIIAAFGDQFIDSLIERAANLVSPFPGKETAVEVLKDKVAPMLMNQGITWVRKWYAGELPQHEVDALPAAIDPSVISSGMFVSPASVTSGS